MNCNILITGGAGNIGGSLSRDLVNKGYNVTILDNLSTGNKKKWKNGRKKEWNNEEMKESKI